MQKDDWEKRTREQLKNMVHESVEDGLLRMKQEAMDEAINTAMILTIESFDGLLLEKFYTNWLPEFIYYVLAHYKQWQKGELHMDELRKELWEYGGVRLEEVEDQTFRRGLCSSSV